MFEEALFRAEARPEPDSSDAVVGVAAWRLGNFLNERGAHDEARPYYDRLIAVCEAALGPGDLAVATALVRLADFISGPWTDGADAEVRAPLPTALAIRERAHGPVHLDVAEALLGLAQEAVPHDDCTGAAPAERALRIHEAAPRSHTPHRRPYPRSASLDARATPWPRAITSSAPSPSDEATSALATLRPSTLSNSRPRYSRNRATSWLPRRRSNG